MHRWEPNREQCTPRLSRCTAELQGSSTLTINHNIDLVFALHGKGTVSTQTRCGGSSMQHSHSTAGVQCQPLLCTDTHILSARR